MMYKKILIAVDLDPASLQTLGQVKQLGIDPAAEVELVHVFEQSPLGFDFLPLPTLSREDTYLLEQAVTQKLEGIKRELGLPRARVKFLISENARQEFLQHAETERAQLIIAASQEKPGLRGFFEGSFTAFLNKFARCHLLVLRPPR
jgi:nucleotide-binding universal stress UspA family protein